MIAALYLWGCREPADPPKIGRPRRDRRKQARAKQAARSARRR